ncbi:MAG: hypothetical protein GYB49_15020 [Alphaproteobacteria bacterium]|nr:hypothetical protein [Alphaproteobacteria bacterium]|tara:strand:- start:3381 stop:4319 length:939 start_codon:yes stop_codon:yes gene_type:complete
MDISRSVLRGLFASAVMALSFNAAAQQPEGEVEQQLRNETVIVEGEVPTLKESFDFTRELTVDGMKSKLLARWNKRICPAVAGLSPDKGQLIADRISEWALEVDLLPDDPGCKPNLAIFITDSADSLAQQLYELDPATFGLAADWTVSTRGRFAFEDFLETTNPVRWWHVSEKLSEQGHPITGASRFIIKDARAAPRIATVNTTNSSRLKGHYRQHINHGIIIVDAKRVEGVRLDTLADYLAFVSLLQVDPDADVKGANTILNLFDEAGLANTGIRGLTEWDKRYLKAYYKAKRNAYSEKQQEQQIAYYLRK